MSNITSGDTLAWRGSLDTMLEEVTDESARASLTHLRSALEPYFETPELFRAILGKIQMVSMSANDEEKLTTTSFANLEELAASLPEGLTVTTL